MVPDRGAATAGLLLGWAAMGVGSGSQAAPVTGAPLPAPQCAAACSLPRAITPPAELYASVKRNISTSFKK